MLFTPARDDRVRPHTDAVVSREPPGSRLPAPGSRLPAPGSRLPAPGSRRLWSHPVSRETESYRSLEIPIWPSGWRLQPERSQRLVALPAQFMACTSLSSRPGAVPSSGAFSSSLAVASNALTPDGPITSALPRRRTAVPHWHRAHFPFVKSVQEPPAAGAYRTPQTHRATVASPRWTGHKLALQRSAT